MIRILTILFISILFTSCSIDRTIHNLSQSEIQTLSTFQNLDDNNQVRISELSEPGQKLWLCLTFISKETKKPLINEEVNLYHTSSNGDYEPKNPEDESTARLNGTVFTDSKGQIFVQTILSGAYGSSTDNRHIHTTVKNAKPVAYDIHFKQYTGKMGNNFINGSDQHFLADLKQTKDSILVTFLTIEVKNYESTELVITKIAPDCQWCGANEAPEKVNWETIIASDSVEGERLILEGTIFEIDGKTPAKDVIVYAYHTNSQGEYEKKGNQKGNGVRHGYLRAWAKTNKEGKYRFNTIKPAPYPTHSEPAHIHMTLMREDFDEYWINATWFKGDRIITEEMTEKLKRQGGFSNIIELNNNENGTWLGNRDIILNPPKK